MASDHDVKSIVEHRYCTVVCKCGETFDDADTVRAIQSWGEHYATARAVPERGGE